MTTTRYALFATLISDGLKVTDGVLAVEGDRIRFAGNRKLKIYGFLHCASGMRMMKVNRVFFNSVSEAVILGYRPCGHCMPDAYRIWKNASLRLQNFPQDPG